MDIIIKPVGEILEDHMEELRKQSISHQIFIEMVKQEVGEPIVPVIELQV